MGTIRDIFLVGLAAASIASSAADGPKPALNTNADYDIYTNNCHHFANRFAKANQGQQGVHVGVFTCNNYARKTAWTGHTVNWVIQGNQVCLHEPQSGMSLDDIPGDQCLPTQGQDASAVNQAFSKGSRGAQIASRLCDDQGFSPQALPEGQMVAESSVDRCADKESRSLSSCQGCCDDRQAMWPPKQPPEGDAEAFLSGCSSSCEQRYAGGTAKSGSTMERKSSRNVTDKVADSSDSESDGESASAGESEEKTGNASGIGGVSSDDRSSSTRDSGGSAHKVSQPNLISRVFGSLRNAGQKAWGFITRMFKR